MPPPDPHRPLLLSTPKARGAKSNTEGRFEPYQRVRVDDGWPEEETESVLRTEISIEKPRSILSRNKSPDISFDRSINPYRGCEHGCIYCFARPTHAYLGLSPGLDFETRIVAKPSAPELLRKTLARRGYKPKPIAIGTNTDPYQPVEVRLGIMRGILEVLRDHNHPVTIVTKGSLIERDTGILGPMAKEGLSQVGISITTLDRSLSRAMEPRAPAPARRLKVIETLSRAGIPVRAMIAPVIPALTDHELEPLLKAAKEAGAAAASYITLRLPLEVANLFAEWLKETYPARADKVLARVRQFHDGKEYDSEWGTRMTGSGVHANLIAQRFEVARQRLALATDLPKLRCDLFSVPKPETGQLDLFD